jgi:hypothetical protein
MNSAHIELEDLGGLIIGKKGVCTAGTTRWKSVRHSGPLSPRFRQSLIGSTGLSSTCALDDTVRLQRLKRPCSVH